MSVNVISRLGEERRERERERERERRERERERERLGLFAYFGWVFRSRAGLLRYR